MKYISCVLVLLFAGCASSPSPEQHLYFLDAEAETGNVSENVTIGIGVVDIATYLERSEIILQVGPNELRPSRYHYWAEPLQEGVRRYLRDRLSADLATTVDTNRQFRDNWLSQVDITVDKLHGDLDGRVQLEAHYVIQVIADPALQKHVRVRISGDQNGSGYAALVDAQESLLNRLAQRIAADIEELSPTG
jgi:hypothetical protein